MTIISRLKTVVFALAVFCIVPVSAVASAPFAVTLTGRVTDSLGAGIPDAVVMVKTGGNLLAHARALTDGQGHFGPQFRASAVEVADGGQPVLVIRKAGYLPHTAELTGFSGSVGTVSLRRDPLEYRIDSVMALMNLAEKIGQMTQPELGGGGMWPTPGTVTTANSGTAYLYGSVLNGGDGYTSTFLSSMVSTLNGWPAGRARIPTYYGKDAVHGNAGVPGYTVFPHNIGLGATRDTALVRRIGEATAKELWAANIDLNFSPAISVARDLRWGRTYESYGETAELSVRMGAAMVRGLQGERFNAPWRITATAKHFLGDGGTTNGVDRGNTAATDEELRAVHLPGYEAVVEQGVLSVMASFNTINGVHQHVDSLRMTGWLKTELGFDGYIISDWLGIGNSLTPGAHDANNYQGGGATSREAVRDAVNAGIDLAMEPGTHTTFINHLTALAGNGVSLARIDDAVRRILRAKFRAGRMDNFGGPDGFVNNAANRAPQAHRDLAREAVRKSQVLLKNENSALPIAPNASVHVFGSHHDDIGLQCGGWTVRWQGVTGNGDFAGVGTSIAAGMRQVSGQPALAVAAGAGVIVYVTGEEPYAEWYGDIPSLDFTPSAADMASLAAYRSQGKKIVTVFVTGRPRAVPQLIDASDAFMAAWLPGTEGGGVADVLFGGYQFSGQLPFAWPGGGGTVQFPYGAGITTDNRPTSIADRGRETVPLTPEKTMIVRPASVTINGLSAGPNPAARSAGAVNFFWQGKAIENAVLYIYDASGILIRKIKIRDGESGESDDSGRRFVGSWDFTGSGGRLVAAGSYVVKGSIKVRDGSREGVSVVLGVR